MSAVAYPQPKLNGGRPPILPPRLTTFDPSDDGHRDPAAKRLVQNVRHLLDQVAKADPDSYPLLLRLIEQRKAMVIEELQFARMVEPQNLPPLLSNFYSLDFLEEGGDGVQVYVKLLEMLDETTDMIKSKFFVLNTEAPASDL